MSYCKVAGCRFHKTHTTAGHLCGTCNTYGHGRIECNNNIQKASLNVFLNDKLPEDDFCDLGGCKYPWSHNRHAHHCHKCFKNHRSSRCIIQSFDNHASQFQISNEHIQYSTLFLNTHPNSYIKYYVGMGCELYIKKKNDMLESIFMHQDSWGQYGPQTSDTPILNKFIEGLQNDTDALNQFILDYNNSNNETPNPLTTEKKCPVCRTTIKNVLDLKGSEDKCKVCFDNDVELYFTDCSHAVLCKPCYEKI